MFIVAVPAESRQQAAPPAGTVSGRVVDARTGTGLSRALVAVEGGGASVQADEEGRFRLEAVAAGRQRLTVSLVGFIFVRREVDVPAAGAIELVIPLSEGTGTYTETVTVAADRFHVTEPGVASQQALGSADIQNLRGVLADDPLRAVQVLPGVATGDDLRSEFSVRGSPFTQMNLTLDGFAAPFLLHTVRAIEDYSQSGSVAMINSDILDDVTLLNGGYPQRFGNRTGAEVHFRLRAGSRERRQLRAAVSGTAASAVVEGPLGSSRRGSWLFSVRQSYLDLLIDRLLDDGLRFRFADAQAKFVFDATPAQRVELALIAGRSRLEAAPEDLDTDDLFEGANASAMAIASWRLTTSRAVVAVRSMTAHNSFGNDARDAVRLDDGADTQVAGRVDASLVVARGLDLEAGAQAEWTNQARTRRRTVRGAYQLINQFHERASRTGGHAQLRWTAGPLTLVPGVRADHWDLTGEATASPWVQAELRMPRAFSLRGGAGVYRQFPEFEQVVGALAAPDPRALRARHLDFGIEHRITPALRWQLTVYDREERGFFRRVAAETRLVNGRVVSGTPSAPFQQRLDGRARGVELLVQRKDLNGLSGWISYAYGRHRRDDVVSGERYWADLDQRHTLNIYVFQRLSDRMSVSAKLRAGSNTPAPGYYREDGDRYRLSATRNELRLPAYARLDLRANRTYSWGARRLTLFAEVMNALNRDNVRFSPPGVSRATLEVRNLFEPLIPIVPAAGVLIEW